MKVSSHPYYVPVTITAIDVSNPSNSVPESSNAAIDIEAVEDFSIVACPFAKESANFNKLSAILLLSIFLDP